MLSSILRTGWKRSLAASHCVASQSVVRSASLRGFELSPVTVRPLSNTAAATTTTTTNNNNNNKAAEKHQQIENVLKSTTSSTSSKQQDIHRKQRTRQAMINAAISFFVVVLAAQGVKNAHEKRKATRKVEVLEELLTEKQALLAELRNEAFLRKVAQDCGAAVGAPASSSSPSWWSHHTTESQDGTEEKLYKILSKAMQQQLGSAGLSEKEKDRNELAMIVSESGTDAEVKEMVIQEDEESDGTVIVKKRVYAF